VNVSHQLLKREESKGITLSLRDLKVLRRELPATGKIDGNGEKSSTRRDGAR